jgi:hypothetical protein
MSRTLIRKEVRGSSPLPMGEVPVKVVDGATSGSDTQLSVRRVLLIRRTQLDFSLTVR